MVSIIACTMRSSYMDNIFDNYERQVFEKKEMIIVLNRDDMDVNEWRRKAKMYHNVYVYKVPGRYKLGRCLNKGIKKAKYDIVAKFDDDDYYAPYYLKEAVDSLRHKRVSVVGKHTSYVYFEGKALMIYRRGGEGKYLTKLKGGTLVFKKSVWNKVKFSEKRVYGCDAHFLGQCRRKGFKIYSVSKHNYVCVRRNDLSSHTQKTNANKYMARCKFICHTNDYIPIISKKF